MLGNYKVIWIYYLYTRILNDDIFVQQIQSDRVFENLTLFFSKFTVLTKIEWVSQL